jgi:hypothetical protein
MEGAEAELDAPDHGASRGKRRRSRAAKENPRRRRGADREKQKESAEAEEPAAADDDVCAEEPDSEEMAMEEDEAVAALEAEEEEAKAGGEGSAEKVGARKRVARPSTERRVDGSADHFVGEPMPDHEARQRWPERYMTKVRRPPEQVDLLFHLQISLVCSLLSTMLGTIMITSFGSQLSSAHRV